MKTRKISEICFVCFFVVFYTILFADSCVIDSEFADTDLVVAPFAYWESAGSHVEINPVFVINVTDIPDSVTYILEDVATPIPSANPYDEIDDYLPFSELINWMNTYIVPQGIHGQIYIPGGGRYILSDKLVLCSNISLKGEGSDSTILEFQIKDTATNTVNSTHFNKNAIEIVGSINAKISNVGIEDITIKRCYGEIDLTHPNMANFVFVAQFVLMMDISQVSTRTIETLLDWYFHDTPTNIYQRNNIYIEMATNCWIIGVESAKTNRHHVMIMGSKRQIEFDDPVVTDKISISGCYFHDAANHGRFGFGYGVEIFDNCQEILVENNIFRNLRHGIIVSDRSRFNVIGYNYILDPHITENTILYGSEYTGDIVFHGQPSNNSYSDGTDDSYGPTYNLVEGNSCRAIWVDSYHGKNGLKNAFLRNRIYDIGMHIYGPWAIESIFYSLMDDEVYWPSGFCQPRQLIVNNFMKCTHWFLSNFYAFPRRLKGDPHFEMSTKQRAINFWGKVFNSNKEWDSEVWESNYSYYKVNRPDFFPEFSNWPLNPKDELNPAQLRWEASGKLTVGRDDIIGYAGIHHYTSDVTFSNSFTVDEGEALIIDKGVTVSIAPGKKIIIKGTLIALGNENQPISFVCSDSTQSWKGIEVFSSNDAKKPNVTLSYCKIKQSRGRALSMQDYNRAIIENCQIEHNSGGGIFSENGNLQLHGSIIHMNTVSNSFNHHGAGLSLSSTNAEIISTLFSSNQTYLTGGGAIHITGTPADSSKVDLYNCYFTENTGQLSPPINGWAIQAEGLNSVLSLYNCSFVKQGNALKSTLDNDVNLINCLFWNSGSDNHQITSDNLASTHEYKLSHCYLPNFEQNINQSIAAIVDTIYTGQFGAVYTNGDGFTIPLCSSPLLNSGNQVILEESDIRSFSDVLGNPRVCGVGIDIGAIEIMKPELVISDTAIDFGMVDVFCVADSTIRIENLGAEDLELYSIYLPTGYTVDQSFPLTVPTGYSSSSSDNLDFYIDLKVSFSPIYHQTAYFGLSEHRSH